MICRCVIVLVTAERLHWLRRTDVLFIPDVAIDDLRKLYLIHVSLVISSLEDGPTTSKAVIHFYAKKSCHQFA